jgi:hypothetical protein
MSKIEELLREANDELQNSTKVFENEYYQLIKKSEENSTEDKITEDEYESLDEVEKLKFHNEYRIKAFKEMSERRLIFDTIKLKSKPTVEDFLNKYVRIIKDELTKHNEKIKEWILTGELGRVFCDKYGYSIGSKKHLRLIDILCTYELSDSQVERFIDIQMNGLGFKYYLQRYNSITEFNTSSKVALKKFNRSQLYSSKKYSDDYILLDLKEIKFL